MVRIGLNELRKKTNKKTQPKIMPKQINKWKMNFSLNLLKDFFFLYLLALSVAVHFILIQDRKKEGAVLYSVSEDWL